MCSNIKVSIITTVYNAEKYIERCIKSVLNQSLKEIEMIVINDGSVDNSQEIIANLAIEDSRLVVIYKENGGESSALNAGLEIARGAYIQQLDGDDWIEKTACEEAYEFANKNDLDIVVCDYYRDNNKGKVRYVRDLSCGKNIYSAKEYFGYFLKKKSSSLAWSKLVRSDLCKSVKRPLDQFMSADFITVFRWILKANKVGKIDKAFIHWMSNPESVTRKAPSKLMYQTFEIYDEMERILKSEGKYEVYKDDVTIMRHFSFIAFFTQKPFYADKNYQRGLEYMLLYLKQNNNPEKVDSSRYFLIKVLKKYPYKPVFYALNFIFYCSPF
jgi:glycosyltransferase involved in cell wall biosynthesis